MEAGPPDVRRGSPPFTAAMRHPVAEGKTRADMRSLMRGVFRERAKGPMLTVNLLRQHWADVVGPELAARTWPQRMERGTLWIAAPDSAWVYELQFFKAELLSSLEAFLEHRAITDLRFRVGELPPAGGAPVPPADEGAGEAPSQAADEAKGGPPETAPPRPRLRERLAARSVPATPTTPADPAAPAAEDPPPDAPPRLAEAARAIPDPALRAVFQRSLSKQRRGRAPAPPPDPDRSEEP